MEFQSWKYCVKHHFPEKRLLSQKFREVCRASGMKATSQRMAIYEQLACSRDHPDAETIHQSIVKKLPAVSLDTVYRNLWLFNKLGLATVLSSPFGRRRFEGNLAHHHHFICLECGSIQDYDEPELDRLPIPESISQFGKVEKTAIEFRGRCRKCLKKSAKEASSGLKKKKKK